MKKTISVAIAILNQQGKTLIAWRHPSLHQGGQYEFAGGKVELGETAEQACRREVWEEVGIWIEHWQKLDEVIYDYGDKIVQLHFFQSHVAVEQNKQIKESWQWIYRDELWKFNFPKANNRIIQYLMWQNQIKIHHQLPQKIKAHQLFYWRFNISIDQAIQQLKNYPTELFSQLIINIELYQRCPVDIQNKIMTIHLKEQQLLSDINLPLKKRLIASCHHINSLDSAEKKGCSSVFCSPICQTATHPDVQPLGWSTLRQWSTHTSCLIFALGGVSPLDLAMARQYGAFGVAGISAF